MYNAWLRSGNHNNAYYANSLTASGGRSGGPTYCYSAVRPASSNVVNLKKSRIPRAFGSVARMYDAWLRSGSEIVADGAFIFGSGGKHSGDSTDLRYAVRPASSNAVNFKKVADTPRFWVCRSHI